MVIHDDHMVESILFRTIQGYNTIEQAEMAPEVIDVDDMMQKQCSCLSAANIITILMLIKCNIFGLNMKSI